MIHSFLNIESDFVKWSIILKLHVRDLLDQGGEGGEEVSHVEERLEVLAGRGNYGYFIIIG